MYTSQQKNFIFPYPPSINHYYGIAKRISRYAVFMTAKTKAWHREVLLTNKIYPEPIFTNPDIKVNIIACPPDKRKRDLDNILKPILDILQHLRVIKDDALIVSLTIEKKFDEKDKIYVAVAGTSCYNVIKKILSNIHTRHR